MMYSSPPGIISAAYSEPGPLQPVLTRAPAPRHTGRVYQQRLSDPAMPSLPPATVTRQETLERLFGHLAQKSVLVIGIGGGGDVVSTLPTCFDLERLGARTIPAGLTWKRMVHDPAGRPRSIDSFQQVEQMNELIGEANPATRLKDGIVHIEAHVSSALAGRPIAMIDITPGSAQLREALLDYCRTRSIEAIIGVDAGGDVLCVGHEPTLESPICDQTVLAALARIPDSTLGVFGFGADGEMPLSALIPRFASLSALGAFRGLLPIAGEDIPRMMTVLESAPTEASRLPMVIAQQIAPERLKEVHDLMNCGDPDLTAAIGEERSITMRGGFRTARLSDLSATTIYFDSAKVAGTSQFADLWDDQKSIDEMHTVLTAAGIITEFTEQERTSLTTPKK